MVTLDVGEYGFVHSFKLSSLLVATSPLQLRAVAAVLCLLLPFNLFIMV